LGTNLRVWKTHHQTGADDGGGGTAWFRKESSAPTHSFSLLDLRAGTDQDSLDLLAHAAASNFPGTGGSLDCVVSLPRFKHSFLTSGTSDPAVRLVLWDQENADGLIAQALSGRPAAIVNSYSTHPRWPGYWEPLAEAGYRSIATAPLALEPGKFAALTLLSDSDDVFTPAALTRLAAFSEVAASSFRMAAELRTALATVDQLRTAMQGRTSIDVACGVIMGQNRCSYQDAFQILAKASSHRNVKARVVAETILSDLPGGSPSTHFKG
jgi:GAF domain-containing protein